MKIAIPLAEGKLALHFGHCQEFALLEVNEQDQQITQQEVIAAPPHQPGLLPRWLHEKGVNLVISGGMGMRAQNLFAEQGINVIVGAPAQSPEELVKAYLAKTLVSGTNLCDH